MILFIYHKIIIMEYLKIIRAFGILNRTFLNYISNELTSEELSYSDSIFLVNIGNNEGTTQEEIANSLAIDKAAIARSVKNMEKKGYIQIERSKIDKRAKELYLTDYGKKLFNYIQQLNHQWIDYVMSDLDPDDIKVFIKTIDHVSNRAKNFKGV